MGAFNSVELENEVENKASTINHLIDVCRIHRDFNGIIPLKLKLAQLYIDNDVNNDLVAKIYLDVYAYSKDVSIGQKALDIFIRKGLWSQASILSHDIGMQTKSEKHLEEAIEWTALRKQEWQKDLYELRFTKNINRLNQIFIP